MRYRPTAAERLGDYVAGLRFNELPDAVVEHTKDLLISHLALMFAGRFTERGREALALAADLSGGGGASTLIGERHPATLLEAVAAHVELIDINRDARHLRSKTTPGRVNDPIAWSVGEREHASGRELIVASIAGYDIECVLAEPVLGDPYDRVPHKCGFASFGGAATAARLLGHDAERTARALGRAAHVGMGLNAGLGSAGTFAAIARSSLVAALIVSPGHSSLLDAVDGPNGLYAALFGGRPSGLDASLERLGREHPIMGALTQRYPGSATHLAALEALLGLVASGVDPSQVESVVAHLPAEFTERFAHIENAMERARTRDERAGAAAGSLRLKLALLVLDRRITPRPTLEQYDDDRSAAMYRRVSLVFEPMPDETARVEVRLRGGEVLRAEGVIPSQPRGDWHGWLHADGERFLTNARLDELERLLTNLEDVPDVGAVLTCTVP